MEREPDYWVNVYDQRYFRKPALGRFCRSELDAMIQKRTIRDAWGRRPIYRLRIYLKPEHPDV